MNRFIAPALAMLVASSAFAQGQPTLADPTRPPSVGPESTAETSAPTGPRLQSVLISPTRRSAVISGQAVAAGARYGDATVESISESAVVLRYADRRETLQLIPGLNKRERRAADNASGPAAAREKGTTR